MKVNEIIAKAVKVADDLEKEGKNIPILLMSHPGNTKTTSLDMLSKVINYNLYTLILSRFSDDSVVGLDSVDEESKKNNTTKRLKPSWLVEFEKLAKNGKRNILFIDELSTATPFIQGPVLDLIFNKTLGTYSLPKNTIIVAGANYSVDLEDNFNLLSPVLNRFMIINLSLDDVDFNEVANFDINNLKTQEDYKNYLNIKQEKNDIDYNLVKNYLLSIISSKDKTIGSYDENIGQLGFLSVRSFSYSLNFLRVYFNNFNDDLWVRIVGDTLGVCGKLEKAYRELLASFIKVNTNPNTNILNKILDSIKNGNMQNATQLLNNTNIKEFSQCDVAKIQDEILHNSSKIKEEDLKVFIDLLMSKLV